MTSPRQTYETRLHQLQQEASRQKRKLRGSSLLRILVFASAAFLAYVAFQGTTWAGFAALGLAGVFAYLVARHQDLKYAYRRLLALIDLNQTELRVLQGDFEDLPDGHTFLEADHAFAGDLDLFGPGSFYQYLNRTGLTAGGYKLASWLGSNRVDRVPQRQEAVRELTPEVAWRQEFTATARLIESPLSGEDLTGWLGRHVAFLPKWVKYVPGIFSLLSLVLGVGLIFGLLPIEALVAWFFTGLLITLPFAKKIGHLAGETSNIQEAFRQYGRLVSLVEGRDFKGTLLRDLKATLEGSGVPVSEVLKRFHRRISALDQRHNLLVAVFGNAFFLWDLRQAYRVEQWIVRYGPQVPQWFGALSSFDAFGSLANFAFNHPTASYPEVRSGEGSLLEVRELGHPLLFGEVVRNDLRLEKGHFMVITGANMAGKSTFLRAVSLSLVMANTGLPVFAEAMAYTPIPLITSMRTADSLTRHESYFFAELKRLKRIVDHLQTGSYFVVLDEILKGTNSRDKARGSREFLERLLQMPATGLIATHDLSLCEVAADQPRVGNYFFDVEIREGELFFDYRLKPGVCSNMNASFLLRKLGVVEEGSDGDSG